jgi:hypothetical protein
MASHSSRSRIAIVSARVERPIAIWLWALLLAALVVVPGCGSCRRKPLTPKEREALKLGEERRKKEAEKPKPDFVLRQLNTLPYHVDRPERAVKPGHWSSGTLEALANNFDFRGRVQVDPLDLDEMPFRLATVRDGVLPKGQRRELDLIFFTPAGINPRAIRTSLQTRRGSDLFQESFPLVRMPAHQFYLVALARTPESYAFLRELDTVQAPSGRFGTAATEAHYRPIAPVVKNEVPLPTNSLTWTAIACLIWDDFEPDKLTPPQQQALLDWIHWGGQLIISGPSSLGLLKGSFLADYLPVESGGAMKLSQTHLAPLSDRWSAQKEPLRVTKPWPGERLICRPDAQIALAAGELPLVVDRRLGRGRITVTAFPLAQRRLVEWSGFDSFFNGCLLRRPAREFRWSEETVVVDWADRADFQLASRVSQLRYFTRDAGDPRSWHVSGIDTPFSTTDPEKDVLASPVAQPVLDFETHFGPGVAGWDDFGDVANAARNALREAAGIKIPKPSFVMWLLAAYLIVLVPVNWGVFRAIGRVELAWVAAPLISLGGALLVVRAAQLDIGFVRATNELAVVELQPHYPRAHVTRYTALYTSLSTRYEVELSDTCALIQPFPDGTGLLRGQSRQVVTLRTGEKIDLDSFRVSSNSIGLLHAEHMLPMEGGVELQVSGEGGQSVVNHTPWTLQGARVVGAGKRAFVGDLRPGESRPLRFETIRQEQVDSSPMPPPAQPGQVNIGDLLAVAEADASGAEQRLVAWTTDPLPGMVIRPAASQSRQMCLIVAHLEYGRLPACEHDSRTRRDVENAMGIRPTSNLDTGSDEGVVEE